MADLHFFVRRQFYRRQPLRRLLAQTIIRGTTERDASRRSRHRERKRNVDSAWSAPVGHRQPRVDEVPASERLTREAFDQEDASSIEDQQHLPRFANSAYGKALRKSFAEKDPAHFPRPAPLAKVIPVHRRTPKLARQLPVPIMHWGSGQYRLLDMADVGAHEKGRAPACPAP